MSGDYPYASPPEAKTWQAPWPPAGGRAAEPAAIPPLPLQLIVAGVLLVLSGGNLLMIPIADAINPSQPGLLAALSFLSACVGSIGAQAALLAILVALGPEPLWQRQLWHWGLVLVAYAAWCLGFAMAEWDRVTQPTFDWQEFWTPTLALPLVALGCQAGPWLVRIYGRWRVERLPGPTPGEHAGSPFLESQESRITIRELLLGTVFVALCLAAVRLGKPDDVGDSEYWIALLSICGSAMCVMAVGVLPIVYLVLGTRKWLWGVAGVLAIGTVAAATLDAILLYIPGGPTGVEKTALSVSLVGGFLIPLAGTLLLARTYGYRLIRV